MLNNRYIVIIPAYNEESTILECLDHVLQSSHSTPLYTLDKIVVCVNGCTDDTEKLAKSWHGAPIDVIKSRPGYIHAVNRLFSYARKHYPSHIMVKTDADCQVDPKAFSVLFTQLERHPEIIVAGGHPLPIPSSNRNPYRRMMSELMSVRSRTPEAEVTVADTTPYHPYAIDDPIPELNGREEKLKVYFHGRLWCARTAISIPLLPPGVIGDDIFLPAWLFQRYGQSSMRLDYRANVWFHPNDSLTRHWRVYRRIFEDRNIVYTMDGFESYASACPLKLDWGYILTTCPLRESIYFMCYALLVRFEKFSYKFSAYNASYWQYSKKEI
ncbi:MAG: glycosyltransferase family 2 protein [Candidatus Saccharimonas sp.]